MSKRLFTVLFLFPILALASGAPEAPARKNAGWESYSNLQNGNMRFYEGRLKHPNQTPERREALATGQKPHTIVVACSDSRVGPETIFDQGLGDLFTVRLAGNVITTEAIASIEYAVEHLGPKLLIVVGHESCGAVGAAINSKPGVSNGSESLDTLVNKIRGNLTPSSMANAANDKTFRQPVKDNVDANLRELLKRSDIVREAVAKKGLVLAQGIYSLKTGRVEFWDLGTKLAGGEEEETFADGPVILEHQVVEENIARVPAAKPVKKKKAAPAPAAPEEFPEPPAETQAPAAEAPADDHDHHGH